MTYEQIRQHVKIIGWLHIAGGVLFLVIGGFVFFLLTSIGFLSMEAEAIGVLSLVATLVVGIMLLLALPSLLAGWGLLKGRDWGRILAIIVSFLNITNFPFGTLLAIYTLYVLLQSEASAYFTGLKKA
ncbi:MAG: hypothetical protein R3272_15960 [Candidatus Promineifilaceae bacterium]|nr:hypothetical protein [Candidatus Promineifilaceae bacterium]